MLFKAAERKTSTGMARLLQDKGPQGKDEVWIFSLSLGWKKELEEWSCRSLQARAGEQGTLPQLTAASRVWIQQPRRLGRG